jgi:hypothetical protein
MESFRTELTCGCKRKVWKDKWVQDLPNDLAHALFCLQPYVVWSCHYDAMLFKKNDVMHMFMETRCMCSCSRFLWCMPAWLGYPQNEIAIERTITSWEGVCMASRILTTKIPSARLVAIMWLQRTWRPRFRHGTFSYGITTSPNTKDRVRDIGKLHVYAR